MNRLMSLVAVMLVAAPFAPLRAETPRNMMNLWEASTAGKPGGAAQGETGDGVPGFWVRPGYRVDLAAADFGEARFLEFGDDGTLYVSQPGRGSIVALRPGQGASGTQGDFDTTSTFVSGMRTAHGMCFRDGWLWFSTTGAIHKAHDTNGDGKADEVVTVIPEGQLPKGGGHWWRSLLVTDDAIYTSIGDAGNITDQTDTERQKIWRFKKDGTGKTLFAAGLRNTEKLRLRPGTGEVWGADHGSDWYGKPLGDKEGNQPITDLNPPDEFNHYVEGGFYGHPFLWGTRVPRVEYQERPDLIELAARTIPPAWGFGAHWATNGFCFLDKPGFTGTTGDAMVGCHGSWNRKEPAGYRVERVVFDPVTGKPSGSLTIVGTQDAKGKVLGRPVDCVQAADGSVLFSDDMTQRIYRISAAKK